MAALEEIEQITLKSGESIKAKDNAVAVQYPRLGAATATDGSDYKYTAEQRAIVYHNYVENGGVTREKPPCKPP